jgi:hypothetical protein
MPEWTISIDTLPLPATPDEELLPILRSRLEEQSALGAAVAIHGQLLAATFCLPASRAQTAADEGADVMLRALEVMGLRVELGAIRVEPADDRELVPA